jgi:Immunoglobulin-like domain of bacterial spore germination
MIRYAAFACLALAACTPEAKPPETPAVAEEAAPDVATQADATDAQKYKPAPDGEITVKTPLGGARVTSPLIVEGVAINDWFFEGQFVAELVFEGEVIVQAPAMQSGDKSWTDPGPVEFKAELSFDVTKEQSAELILSEDMPEYIDEANDIRGPARSIRIPVVLLPPAK